MSHPLVFNLLYNTSESHQRIAIAASSMWKKNLGVEAKLQNQEWKTMLDTMHTHNFDAVRYAWIADYDDAATFLNNFRTGDSENTSQYSNPAYDEALRNAAKARHGGGASSTSRRRICWRGCPGHSGLSLCPYPPGEAVGRGIYAG
jgi:oligopeptide transport system substrate-binding protein